MSALFLSPAGGDAQRVQAGQVLDLTTPESVAGVVMFRRTLYLLIPLDDACDRLSLAAASALALRFEPCTVVVHAGDTAWVKRWSGFGATVQVELTYPAPLTRVDSDLYGQAALHRQDGTAVSAEATVSGDTGAPLPTPFVGAAFELRLDGERHAERLRFRSDAIVARQAGHRSLSAAAVGLAPTVQMDDDLKAVDSVVDLLHGLTALRLAGTPGSPRLTLRAADGAEVLWQWIEPGPQTANVDFAAAGLATDWQPALDQALALIDRALVAPDGSKAPRPAALVLPLEVASDSPCRVRVQQAAVGVLLERPLLKAPFTLHFDGVTSRQQTMPLSVPQGARWLRVDGALTASGGAAADGGAGAVGVLLADGAQARIPLRLDGPQRCAGVAVGWHPLGAHTALRASLVDGGGRELAGSSLDTDDAGAGIYHLRWPAADLQGDRYVLRLAAGDGGGVLAAAEGAGAEPIVVSDGTGERTLPLTAQVVLLDTEESAAPPVAIALGDTALAVKAAADGNFSAALDPVPAPPATDASTLNIESDRPLTLRLTGARVAYELTPT